MVLWRRQRFFFHILSMRNDLPPKCLKSQIPLADLMDCTRTYFLESVSSCLLTISHTFTLHVTITHPNHVHTLMVGAAGSLWFSVLSIIAPGIKPQTLILLNTKCLVKGKCSPSWIRSCWLFNSGDTRTGSSHKLSTTAERQQFVTDWHWSIRFCWIQLIAFNTLIQHLPLRATIVPMISLRYW